MAGVVYSVSNRFYGSLSFSIGPLSACICICDTSFSGMHGCLYKMLYLKRICTSHGSFFVFKYCQRYFVSSLYFCLKAFLPLLCPSSVSRSC